MNFKSIIRYNKLAFTIILFLIMFSIIHIVKPGLFYNTDGSFREFGVGYRQKTVIPIWIVSIILAILCYLLVLNYLMHF